MYRRAATVLAVLALGAASAACSDDDKDGGDEATDATTTTSVTVPATTVTTLPSGPAKTPEAAANGLFNAWKKTDKEDASRYARPSAIEKMFDHPYNDASVVYTDQGCQPQGGQFICAWSYEGGAVSMTVEAWPGGGFVVDSVTYIAD